MSSPQGTTSDSAKALPTWLNENQLPPGADPPGKTQDFKVPAVNDDVASPDLTLLLKAWRAGDEQAGERVFEAVYGELKRIASSYLRRESNRTLETVELVNEAYIRLLPRELVFEDRAHFFGIAARCMRQILVERARRKAAVRRNGGQQLTLGDRHDMAAGKPLCLIQLDNALKELERFDPKKARLVELRFFTGMTLEETAAVLKSSVSSVKREWLLARAWLYNRLNRI